jgi:t-SNARE complex subunit (syntaxin)
MANPIAAIFKNIQAYSRNEKKFKSPVLERLRKRFTYNMSRPTEETLDAFYNIAKNPGVSSVSNAVGHMFKPQS